MRKNGSPFVPLSNKSLQHGNSEVGLQLLEGLVQTHPEVLENHLGFQWDG